MPFNQQDHSDFDNGNKYFPAVSVSTTHDQHSVMKIQIGNNLPPNDAAIVLSKHLQAATRFFHSSHTTVWVDIQSPTIPNFVGDGIKRAAGFGYGLIVTHGNCCSHAPGNPLPQTILDAMKMSQRDAGPIWHPVSNQLISPRV